MVKNGQQWTIIIDRWTKTYTFIMAAYDNENGKDDNKALWNHLILQLMYI